MTHIECEQGHYDAARQLLKKASQLGKVPCRGRIARIYWLLLIG